MNRSSFVDECADATPAIRPPAPFASMTSMQAPGRGVDHAVRIRRVRADPVSSHQQCIHCRRSASVRPPGSDMRPCVTNPGVVDRVVATRHVAVDLVVRDSAT